MRHCRFFKSVPYFGIRHWRCSARAVLRRLLTLFLSCSTFLTTVRFTAPPWEDPEYRNTPSAGELADLPENPAGVIGHPFSVHRVQGTPAGCPAYGCHTGPVRFLKRAGRTLRRTTSPAGPGSGRDPAHRRRWP
ncbi:mersacidin/lichenicidin family type 2 lantibiotic [Streptomyces sp. MAI_2237]